MAAVKEFYFRVAEKVFNLPVFATECDLCFAGRVAGVFFVLGVLTALAMVL